jgi:hypothetical protein
VSVPPALVPLWHNMSMPRSSARQIVLSDDEHPGLTRPTVQAGLCCGRIVLAAGYGETDTAIVAQLLVHVDTGAGMRTGPGLSSPPSRGLTFPSTEFR